MLEKLKAWLSNRRRMRHVKRVLFDGFFCLTEPHQMEMLSLMLYLLTKQNAETDRGVVLDNKKWRRRLRGFAIKELRIAAGA